MIGGYRHLAGWFAYSAAFTYFWSSTQEDADLASNLLLSYNNSGIGLYLFSKGHGFSVRCLGD